VGLVPAKAGISVLVGGGFGGSVAVVLGGLGHSAAGGGTALANGRLCECYQVRSLLATLEVRRLVMMLRLLWFCACALALWSSAIGQRLAVEAVYRDSSGAVTKLEREYQYANGLAPLFVTVYSDGGRGLRRTIQQHGDTIIERRDCYELPGLSRWEAKRGYDMTIASGGDSTFFTWTDGTHVVFDTVVPVRNEEKFRTLIDQHHVAPLVHSGELTITPHELVLLESWTWRSIGDKLLDLVVSDGRNQYSTHQVFDYADTSFVARARHVEDSLPYAIDSLQWDKKRSHYVAKQYWTDKPVKFESSGTVIMDRTVYVQGNDTVWCKWRYYNTPWTVLLRNASLREGGLCSSEMLNSREALIEEERSTTGTHRTYENEFDDRGRILSIRAFSAGSLRWRVDYSYY